MTKLTRSQKRVAQRRLEKNPTLIKDLFDKIDKKEAIIKEKELNNWKTSKQRKLAIGLIIFILIVINLLVWL